MKQIEVSQREGEAAEEDVAISGVAQSGYYNPGTLLLHTLCAVFIAPSLVCVSRPRSRRCLLGRA